MLTLTVKSFVFDPIEKTRWTSKELDGWEVVGILEVNPVMTMGRTKFYVSLLVSSK